MEAYVAAPVRLLAAAATAKAQAMAGGSLEAPPWGKAATCPWGVAHLGRAGRLGGQSPRRRCSFPSTRGRRERPAAQRRVAVVASVGREVPLTSPTGGSDPAVTTAAATAPTGAALDSPCDTQVFLYDTTLRDGTQQEGISLSVMDKLRVVEELDQFGLDYIEGKAAGVGACGGHCRWQVKGGEGSHPE